MEAKPLAVVHPAYKANCDSSTVKNCSNNNNNNGSGVSISTKVQVGG